MSDIREVLVLLHSHLDIGYTHHPKVVWELQRRFIDLALDLSEQTTGWPEPDRLRWTIEATAPLLHWLKTASPAQIDRLRLAVRDNRLGVAALRWHPTPLADHAGLKRLVSATDMLRDRLGLPLRTAILHDVNGLPWPMVGVLRDAGIEMLITGINICMGTLPMPRPAVFHWVGPDGRSIPTFLGDHYQGFDRIFRTSEGNLDKAATSWENYRRRLEAKGYPFDFAFMTATHPFYPDNNPPTLRTVEFIRRWNQEGRTPRLRTITPEMLLERVRAAVPESAIPRCAGDWTDAWSFGVGSCPRETAAALRARATLRALDHLNQSHPVPEDISVARLREQALDNLDRYIEHTFSAARAGSFPDRLTVHAAEAEKSNAAYASLAVARMLLRDKLDHLAGNPVDASGAQGILLVNPTEMDRRELVRVPLSWLDPQAQAAGQSTEEGQAAGSLKATWHHFASTLHGIDIAAEMLDETNSAWVGPFDLPARSVTPLPGERVRRAPQTPAGAEIRAHTLRSTWFELQFDPAGGTVTALRDLAAQRDMLDATSPWPFFGYVHESVDAARFDPNTPNRGREAFFDFDWNKLHADQPGWKPAWPALRRGPERLTSCTTALTPLGAELRLTWQAPGVHQLQQTIRLCAYRRAIECLAWLDKLDTAEPESIYFAFPFRVGAAGCHYDTAGQLVAHDRAQLAGVTRDYLCVEHGIGLHDGQWGVALACPDAPMVQPGGCNWAKCRQPSQPLGQPALLAWPVNNYWQTNFPVRQPGRMSWRWEVVTRDGPNLADLWAAVTSATQPIIAHPRIG